MTKHIIITVLAVSTLLLTTSIAGVSDVSAATTKAATTASAYQQSLQHDNIKLRATDNHKKKAKIKDTSPLPPLNRPSIRAKAFHLQQYRKAAASSQQKPPHD